jgi:hypothetical protein
MDDFIESKVEPDDKNCMVETLPGRTTAPARQAENILRAWRRRDAAALRAEFEKGLSLCATPGAPGDEEERIDLLRAVAAKLGGYPAGAGLEPADPVVGLCLTLLSHLATQPQWAAHRRLAAAPPRHHAR